MRWALLFLLSFQVSAFERSAFEGALSNYFDRIDRVGSIEFSDNSSSDCPLEASSIVTGSLSGRSGRAWTYECIGCLIVDDNYFTDVEELECHLVD